MIRFSCPACKCVLESPDHKAKLKINCPKCGQRLQIPSPANKTVLGVPLQPNKTVLGAPLEEQSPIGPAWMTNPPAVQRPLAMSDVLSTPADAFPLDELEVLQTPRKSSREKYCHECGTVIRFRAEICTHCGVRQPDDSPDRGRDQYEPHRATTLLVLGIIGFFTAPFIFGPMAWFMANEDLRKMDNDIMDPHGRSTTQMAKMVGIINTVWAFLIIVLPLVFLAVMFLGCCGLGAMAPAGAH
jgi:hypothetical protein